MKLETDLADFLGVSTLDATAEDRATNQSAERKISAANWACRYMVESFDKPQFASLRADCELPAFAQAVFEKKHTEVRSNGVVLHQLFVTVGHSRTQLHRDHYDNFYSVCAGSPRVWYVANGTAAEWLWPRASPQSDPQPNANKAAVTPTVQPFLRDPSWGVAGSAQGPPEPNAVAVTKRMVQTSFRRFSLWPGDALFLPCGFFHAVQAGSRPTDRKPVGAVGDKAQSQSSHTLSVATNFYFMPPEPT
jgi:hypothetical protein